MKTNERNGKSSSAAFRNACIASCQKILAQIKRTKEAIFTESRHALERHERALRLALNEAEAQAWQTLYPHLVFPVLAAEKVQAVVAWTEHQQSVRHTSPRFAHAA